MFAKGRNDLYAQRTIKNCFHIFARFSIEQQQQKYDVFVHILCVRLNQCTDFGIDHLSEQSE